MCDADWVPVLSESCWVRYSRSPSKESSLRLEQLAQRTSTSSETEPLAPGAGLRRSADCCWEKRAEIPLGDSHLEMTLHSWGCCFLQHRLNYRNQWKQGCLLSTPCGQVPWDFSPRGDHSVQDAARHQLPFPEDSSLSQARTCVHTPKTKKFCSGRKQPDEETKRVSHGRPPWFHESWLPRGKAVEEQRKTTLYFQWKWKDA